MNSTEYRQMMADLLQDLGYRSEQDSNGYIHASVEDLKAFALRLSTLAGKTPPWSWNYMRNVLNGKLNVSQLLAESMQMLAVSLDGHSPVTLNKSPVTVMAEEGTVAPNSIILTPSKVCKNPVCSVSFIPKHWNQDYCFPTCREVAKKIREGRYEG